MQIVDNTKFNGVFLLDAIQCTIGALPVFFCVRGCEKSWIAFVVSLFLITFALIWKRKI